MRKKMNIAVVFTANIVGGHEVMAIQHIEEFQKNSERISCFIPDNNIELRKLLKDKNINFSYHNVRHLRMEIIHSFFNPIHFLKAILFLNKVKKTHKKIIVVQGDIELGSAFILASKLISTKVTSYIPYTHSFSVMESKGASVKDLLGRIVYKSCHSYIAICDNFAKEIVKKNNNAKVCVLENFVSNPSLDEIRGVGYNFINNEKKITILMAGRIFFRQKGQDCLIEAIRKIENKYNIEIRIIGSGPDLDKLMSLTKSLQENVTVVFLGWKKNVWEHTQDVDFIVIPSNYEGVPLIMLEAIKRNIPVIAPSKDGMIDYLDPQFLYNANDTEKKSSNLADKIASFAIKNNKEYYFNK